MIIQLAEYQPPTRRDQFVELALLIDNVAEPWVPYHVAHRLNQLAADVVDASDREPAQILPFPQREPTAADFERVMRKFAQGFVNAVPPRAAKPEPTLNDVFHRLVEIRKDTQKADNIAGVRNRALELHAAKRKRPTKKAAQGNDPVIEGFRKMVLDNALPPDLQRLQCDMKEASSERPWIKERAQKRAGKSNKLPDEGSIGRVVARIRGKPRKSPAASKRRQTAEDSNG